MSATIESLELELQASSQSAESSLDALSASLEKLKKATSGGVGLTSVVKQINSLGDAAKGVDPASVNNLDGLTKAIQTLSNLGNLKLSSTIATQITAIGNSAKGLSDVDFAPISALASALQSLSTVGKVSLTSAINQLQRIPELANQFVTTDMSGFKSKIQELVSALEPLSTMPKQTISSTLNQIKRIPEVFSGLQAVDMGAFTAKIQELATALKPLADEMNKVAAGFSAFPAKIQKLLSSTNNLSNANKKASFSYINLYAKLRMAYTAVKNIGGKIAFAIGTMNDYIENINLFNASMGKYTTEAQSYAETVGDLMGIDPGEWLRNQGIFMTLATGFGVVSDRAYTMSTQLTQLGYDLSSFFNISFEDSMQKLQSGLSGELEPLRRLGYDLSQAKLQAIALSLGIDKTFSSMTQAEKAQLRYYAIMTQVTTAQGDMARTLNAPANQMRILKSQIVQAARAFGSIFIPALNAVLPYLIAAAKVIRYLASTIASLFGFEMPKIDYSAISSVAGGAEDASDALDDAADSAKKLKKHLLDFDEINVLGSSSDTNGALENIGDFDFKLPEYDFLNGLIDSKVNKIIEGMKEWLGLTGEINSWADFFDTKLGQILITVGAIGGGFAAWKIAKATLKAIDVIKKISSKKIDLSFSVIGATLFMSDLDKLKQYFDDFSENGATFSNVTGMLSEFAGLIGDAMIMLGKVETGAAFKVVQGIGEIVSGINDISKNGVDLDNITDIVRGLTNLAIAVGLFTKNMQLTGAAMAIQGFTTVINEIGNNWDAIKQGDWSGVDKVTLVIGIIEAMGGILTAFNVFSKLKKATKVTEAAESMTEVATATADVSTTTSTLTGKLTTLFKNLGLGIAIIAEVAAAAALFVGAIIVLGKELEQVGIAWQPVLDNAGTVAIALVVGSALLAGIGFATAGLGSLGAELIKDLALGIAVLALMGVSVGLFIAEIWAIGWGLEQVGIAWQPVLDNAGTIAIAIVTSTILLIAIGAACAVLGVASIASCGLLPLAILAGMGMLLEMGAATLLFIAEIWAIGKGLDEVGKAWQPVLDNGDTIKAGIKMGTGLLVGIGVVTAGLGIASVASVGLLPIAIGLGTKLLVDLGDAVVKFNDSLVKVAKSLSNKLQPALRELNGKLPSLSKDMDDFTRFMKFFAGQVVDYSESSAISGFAATVDAIIKFFTKDPIKAMADDAHNQYKQAINLNEKLRLANPELETAISLITRYYDFLEQLEKLTEKTNNISLANGMFVSMKEVGKNLVTGFVDGIKSENSSLSKAVKSVLGDAFSSRVAEDYGYDFGKSLGAGITSGFKNSSFPILKGTVDVTNDGSVSLELRAYAAGGFPDAGQMFIAREAGPEMVGTIGNRSAVANNDQIVEAVSKGVYDAVTSARGMNGGNWTIQLVDNGGRVKSETIITEAERLNRRSGRTIIALG